MRLLKDHLAIALTLLWLIACLAGSGCNKGANRPPEALAPEQVAPTLNSAFKQASPEIKQAANEAVSALQNKDEPRAFVQLQNLSTQSDLTAEQRQAAVRSMMSVLAQLQIAAANGNKAAEDLLQAYRSSK
ncbi:MAG: hypothetical protein DME22_09660 [Verrucomicrobia bacterium]|nr:MAG: hypothetical protein DME22_09660 [Verrucomicrobiota bacterium]PYJ96461.1 MAG: hypothetical protein DME23_20530 [Verrucomicrobiota bacterium]